MAEPSFCVIGLSVRPPVPDNARMARDFNPSAQANRPRAVIIHGLDHARAAVSAAQDLGVPVRLRSAPGAAGYAGALWFGEIVDMARAEYPDAVVEASLDCGDQPGTALAALRQGAEMIRIEGPKAVRDKIAAIADEYGAAIDTDQRDALDLEWEKDAETRCREWLGRGAAEAKR